MNNSYPDNSYPNILCWFYIYDKSKKISGMVIIKQLNGVKKIFYSKSGLNESIYIEDEAIQHFIKADSFDGFTVEDYTKDSLNTFLKGKIFSPIQISPN